MVLHDWLTIPQTGDTWALWEFGQRLTQPECVYRQPAQIFHVPVAGGQDNAQEWVNLAATALGSHPEYEVLCSGAL
jgi:hypothetical protein